MLLADISLLEGITLDENRRLILVGLDYHRVRLGICFRKNPGGFHKELASKIRLMSTLECEPLIIGANKAYKLYEYGIKEFQSE